MAIRWYLLFISTKVAPVFAKTFRMLIITFFFSASSVAILSTALFSTNTEWKKIYRTECNAFVKLCEMWTVNTIMWRFRKSDTECLYVFLFNTISPLLRALSLSRRYEQRHNNWRIERFAYVFVQCYVVSFACTVCLNYIHCSQFERVLVFVYLRVFYTSFVAFSVFNVTRCYHTAEMRENWKCVDGQFLKHKQFNR